MKYLNLKSFRNKDELKKGMERVYFEGVYAGDDHYKEKMEMLELSFDIEPNLGRNERCNFVNGMVVSNLIIDRLSKISDEEIDNEKILIEVQTELECTEKITTLDEYQQEYFRYGVFSAILLKSNENAKEQEKCLKKVNNVL